MQEANTDAEKKAIIDGRQQLDDIRVLIGSTARMGAGMNAQERIVAIHHHDVTWKPFRHRAARRPRIRQGNKLWKSTAKTLMLEIHTYVNRKKRWTAKMWDLNSEKLRMVNGIRKLRRLVQHGLRRRGVREHGGDRGARLRRPAADGACEAVRRDLKAGNAATRFRARWRDRGRR